MQIVALRDNLHEVSDPIFWINKKNITNLLSADSAHSMVSVYHYSSMGNLIRQQTDDIFLLLWKIGFNISYTCVCSWHFEMFFFSLSPENRLWHFMQIIS